MFTLELSNATSGEDVDGDSSATGPNLGRVLHPKFEFCHRHFPWSEVAHCMSLTFDVADDAPFPSCRLWTPSGPAWNSTGANVHVLVPFHGLDGSAVDTQSADMEMSFAYSSMGSYASASGHGSGDSMRPNHARDSWNWQWEPVDHIPVRQYGNGITTARCLSDQSG